MSLNDVLLAVKKRYDFRKEAEVLGVKFELGLLTLKEEQMTNSLDTEKMDSLTFVNETRKTLLSFSIKSIQGEPIPDIIEIKEDGKDTVTKERGVYVREFLDTLPADVIVDLFEMYIDLKEESEVRFSKDIKYNWFKTPEARKKEQEEASTKEEKKEPESTTPEEGPIAYTEIPKPADEEKA